MFNDLDPLERVRVFEKGVKRGPDDEADRPSASTALQIRDGDIISPQIEVSEPLKNQCGALPALHAAGASSPHDRRAATGATSCG